jgi:hypothetical protein
MKGHKGKIVAGAIALCLLIAGLLFQVCSCGALDKAGLEMINIELKIASADLDEIVILVEDDPELEPVLTEFRDVVGKVQEALQVYLDSGISDTSNLIETIQVALTVSEPLIGEIVTSNTSIQRIRFGIIVARAVLRRVEAYCIGAPKPG